MRQALGSTDADRVLGRCPGFCLATQDIVVDAFRIEMLDDEEQGSGAANFVNGYRIGTLAAGAGALILADVYGWFCPAAMAALMVLGMAVTLWLPEPLRLEGPEPACEDWRPGSRTRWSSRSESS